MSEPVPFIYDQVAYEGQPLAQAHPDRLAVLARLHGMNPAPVERARILELGCGDGEHILPLALMLPQAQFLGVDLAASAIAHAQKSARALGVANACFEQGDILEFAPERGQFDYIIAHGVYSWVPAPVRERLMQVARANLAPQGVAYISYNAYPGCHLRMMVRDMLLYASAGVEDPEMRMKRNSAMLQFLSGTQRPALADEVEHARSRAPWQMLHDDAGDFFYPVYFSQFAEHAAQYGLQFLAEAQFSIQQLFALPDETAETIRVISDGDIIREQQFLDFIECRRFRHTLLCRGEVELCRPIDPARIPGLYVSTNAERTAPNEFRGPQGAAMRTKAQHALDAIGYVVDRRPMAVPFDELLQATGGDAQQLVELLAATFSAHLVDLHTVASRFVRQAGERPRAFSLARHQAAQGRTVVSTLRMHSVEIEDAKARDILMLLDGTRTREDLAAAAGTDPQSFETKLAEIGRLALLEA